MWELLVPQPGPWPMVGAFSSLSLWQTSLHHGDDFPEGLPGSGSPRPGRALQKPLQIHAHMMPAQEQAGTE